MPCYHKMFLNSESSELSIKIQTFLLSKQLGIEESEMPWKVKLVVSSLWGFVINCTYKGITTLAETLNFLDRFPSGYQAEEVLTSFTFLGLAWVSVPLPCHLLASFPWSLCGVIMNSKAENWRPVRILMVPMLWLPGDQKASFLV